MTSRQLATAISLGAFVGLQSIAFAQQGTTPRIGEVLQRLDANLNHFDTRVPSFFCDEHVVSQMESSKTRDQVTVTDSIYRLKRTPNSDHTVSLMESREIVKVDGKPATSQDLVGPSLLSGWFEAGLALISHSQSVCTNYSLHKINKNRPDEPYVVRFETVLTPQNSSTCILQEDSTGRAFLDPKTMQIRPWN